MSELFIRCAQSIVGDGIDWKPRLGRMLGIKTDTIDNFAKGKSRIPPGVWNDLKSILEERYKQSLNIPSLIEEISNDKS